MEVAEFRFRVRAAKPDLAKRRDHHDDTQDDHKQHDQGNRPAKPGHQVIHNQVVEDIIKPFCVNYDCRQHGDEQNDRDGHDDRPDFNFFFHFLPPGVESFLYGIIGRKIKILKK